MITGQTADTAPFSLPHGNVGAIGQDSTVTIRAMSASPGDFTRDLQWLAGPVASGPGEDGGVPAACYVPVKVTVHARFVPPSRSPMQAPAPTC